MTPDQILCLLDDDKEDWREQRDDAPSKLSNARRELLDSVRARFGLSLPQLLAQPLDVTKGQILDVRPDLRGVGDWFVNLIPALKEYGKDNG